MVLQNAQAVEDLEQLLADQLDRLALARQLGAQVLQQPGAQVGDQRTRAGQTRPDERQVHRQTALEQVLHRAQTHVHAIQHMAWVVQQLHQRALAGCSQIKVGQFHDQRIWRIGCCSTRQLIDQRRQTTPFQHRVGPHLQLANLDFFAKNLGRQRQLDVQRANGFDHRLAIDPHHVQCGRCFLHRLAVDHGRSLTIGVHDQHTTFDAHLQSTYFEVQVHVVSCHAGGQRQACPLVGAGVVIFNRDGRRLA